MRTIASLIYPDVMSLDVTGPLQVFASANVELRRQGQAEAYRLRVLGEQAGPVATSAGFQLVAEQAWRDCAAAELDTLLVPGGLGETAQCANQPLLAWLRAAEPQVRRLGSVCSGALILAAAGLLDGRRATTHWADAAALRQHAAIEVDGDRLHREAGRVRGDNSFSSRTLDLDLILYGDQVIEKMRVPRPDILEYSFVLGPLAEVAPELRHPVSGETIGDLWRRFDKSRHPIHRLPVAVD